MTEAERPEHGGGDPGGPSPRVVATIREAIALLEDERPDLADKLRGLLEELRGRAGG